VTKANRAIVNDILTAEHEAMDDDDKAALLAARPRLLLREPGAELKPGEVEVPTLPLPPPIDRDELDTFLLAIACTPTGQADVIYETVASFDDPGAVADLCHQALFELPSRDVGRHLTMLSLLGGLRHDSSAEPLERFVWMEDSQVYDTEHVAQSDDQGGSADSIFPHSGLLQARAAEMLVWATGGSSLEAVRRVLDGHPSAAVRVATIDAHLYAADDHEEARIQVEGMVRAEDRWAVGLPRRIDFEDPKAFDAALARRQAELGSEPPLPERRDAGKKY
jgi:hypothetical protein